MPPPTMKAYKLNWVAHYFPCHDHKLPEEDDTPHPNDYWLCLGSMSCMQTEIRLP